MQINIDFIRMDSEISFDENKNNVMVRFVYYTGEIKVWNKTYLDANTTIMMRWILVKNDN